MSQTYIGKMAVACANLKTGEVSITLDSGKTWHTLNYNAARWLARQVWAAADYPREVDRGWVPPADTE